MSTAHAGFCAEVSAVRIVPFWKKGRQFKTMLVQKNIDNGQSQGFQSS